MPLPHRWQEDTSDYPISPSILETVPRPETKELEESNEIKTGTGDDAQPQQEPPVQTDSENQLAAPDIGDKATDNVQLHRPRSLSDVVRVRDRQSAGARSITEKLGDKLFCADRLLESKTRDVAQALIHLEEFLRSATESERSLGQAFSPEKELESIRGRIEHLETMESEAWGWTARISGEDFRSS